ncbi:MAG: anthrone oxygenase family protein [Bradyrhizobium sp.]
MLAILAIISAFAGYADYISTEDVRWLIGGTIIVSSLPYAYFVVTPVNILLYGIRRKARSSAVRELVRDWGLAEWVQTAIGLASSCVYGWAIAMPA